MIKYPKRVVNMSVTRRYKGVSSFQDLANLFDTKANSSSKENTMNTNTNTDTSNAQNETISADILADALEAFRATRKELGEKVGSIASSVTAVTESQAAMSKQVLDLTSTFNSKVEDLTKELNALKAAAATENAPAAKPSLFKRAMNIGTQVGGLAALTGGIAYGGKLAYDKYTGNGN